MNTNFLIYFWKEQKYQTMAIIGQGQGKCHIQGKAVAACQWLSCCQVGKQGQLQRQRQGKVQGRQRQYTGNRFNQNW